MFVATVVFVMATIQAQTASAPQKTGVLVMAKSDKGGSTVYEKSRDEAYGAALRVAATEGVVTLTDKDAGVISVNIGGSHQHGRQARLSITVTPESDGRTRVAVTTQGFQLGVTGWKDGPATKKYFADLNEALGVPK